MVGHNLIQKNIIIEKNKEFNYEKNIIIMFKYFYDN